MRKTAIALLTATLAVSAAAAVVLTRPEAVPGSTATSSGAPSTTSAPAPIVFDPAQLLLDLPDIATTQDWFSPEVTGLEQVGSDALIGANPPEIPFTNGIYGGASRSFAGDNTLLAADGVRSKVRIQVIVLVMSDTTAARNFVTGLMADRGGSPTSNPIELDGLDFAGASRYNVPGEYTAAAEAFAAKGRFVIWIQAFDTNRHFGQGSGAAYSVKEFAKLLEARHPDMAS